MKNSMLKTLLCSAEIFKSDHIKKAEVKNYPPEKIMKDEVYHYVVEDYGLTDEEIKIALLAKQVIYTKTIRNVVVASLVISLALAILAIVPFII